MGAFASRVTVMCGEATRLAATKLRAQALRAAAELMQTSADALDINVWHDQLNNFMKNIASPQMALWSHVVRREYNEFPEGDFAAGQYGRPVLSVPARYDL